MTGGAQSDFTTPAFEARLNALLLGAFSSMASIRVCDSMLPRLAREFGGTVGSAAVVVSSFALAYGLSQLIFGPLGDRFGKLNIISRASLASCLGALACALAGSIQTLALARLVAGAMAASVIPLSLAWIGDSVPYAQRHVMLARLLLGTLSGLIFGQVIGGVAVDTVGWRMAFVVIAIMYGLCFLRLRGRVETAAETAARRAPATDATDNEPGGLVRAYGRILAKPLAALVLPAVFVEGIAGFSALAFVPSMIHERDGVSLSLASLAVAAFGLGGLFYSSQSRAWLRRLGQRGFAVTGGGLFGIGFVLVPGVPGFAAAVAGCTLGGIGLYMLHNTLQTLASRISSQRRGVAMSLFAFLLFLGQSTGVTAGAWLATAHGYRAVFAISALGMAALGSVLAWRLGRYSDAAVE